MAPDWKVSRKVFFLIQWLGSKEGQKDGFDGVLICIDSNTKEITYSAANNKPILIKEYQVLELPYDRMPVGIGEKREKFNLYKIEAVPGDSLYLYTDGYADQFGGPKGKKFKYKALLELLMKNSTQEMGMQKIKLDEAFVAWKNKHEQVDDVAVIGVRVV